MRMTRRINLSSAWRALLFAGALTTGACCPTTAGPTTPASTYTVTLAPGQARFYDADTPATTTQINLTFRIEATDAPLQLRQIETGCEPSAADPCPSYYDTILTARPAGVVQFGNTLQPHGTRTRIVLRNPSETTAISLTMTVVAHRAGCT